MKTRDLRAVLARNAKWTITGRENPGYVVPTQPRFSCLERDTSDLMRRCDAFIEELKHARPQEGKEC